MNIEREILHIDDDPQVTRIIAKRLKPHGYQVTPLHDPTRAIDELIHKQWRVVLSDVDMPGINGLDLLRNIKAHDGGIQVIMLTGVVTMSSVLESLRLGAEACFFKPLSELEPLLEALEHSFHKIDRWWGSLQKLSHLKQGYHDIQSPAGVA